MLKYLYLHIKTKRPLSSYVISKEIQKYTEERYLPSLRQEGEDDNDTNTSQNVTHSLWCRVFVGSSEKRGKELCHDRKRREQRCQLWCPWLQHRHFQLAQSERKCIISCDKRSRDRRFRADLACWAVSPRTLLLPISQGLGWNTSG